MHASWSDAISAALCDLTRYLRNDEDVCARDVALLNDNIDLGNPSLEAAIIAFFSPSSPKFGEAEHRGIAFVGFNAETYADELNSITPEIVSQKVITELAQWRTRLGDRVRSELAASFAIHCLLLPFPDVANFREQFLHGIGVTA